MFKLLVLSTTQAMMICGAQSLFKVAAEHMHGFSFSWAFFRDSILTNWWLLAAGIAAIMAMVEWAYMLRNYPFSQVYPLSSLSFLFGMFVSILFFHETVSWEQWVGVFLILAGCYFIAR